MASEKAAKPTFEDFLDENMLDASDAETTAAMTELKAELVKEKAVRIKARGKTVYDHFCLQIEDVRSADRSGAKARRRMKALKELLPKVGNFKDDYEFRTALQEANGTP
jgi:hypothetical protein